MRGIVTTQTLAIGAIVSASILCATALLVSRPAGEPRKVFLAPDQAIAVRVEVDDPAHFLGEPFSVAVVVQYRPETVDVEPDSLRRLSFAPFEPTGVVFLKTRELDGGIREYRYTSEIRAIELVPGKAYTPLSGTLVYARTSSTAKESLNVAFPEALQITGYYGDHASQTPYRPLRTELPIERMYSKALSCVAGLLFVAFGVLGLRWGREAWDWSGATPEELELRRLSAVLARFADRAWVTEVDPRTRLKQLEDIVVHASPILLGMTPYDLWYGPVDDAWTRVRCAICAAYVEEEPGYDQVEEGRQAVANVFDPVLASMERSRR